jgi:hypothetical protein
MTTAFSQKKGTGQRHFYYRCTTAPKFGNTKCDSRTLPASELEEFTAKILVHAASDNEFLEAVMNQIKGNARTTLELRRSERSDLAANQSSLKKQLNNLAANLTRMGYGENELAEYKAQGGRVEKHRYPTSTTSSEIWIERSAAV